METRPDPQDRRERQQLGDAWTRRLVEILSSPVIYLDREERFRFVNRSFESWFGVTASQLIGRTLREVAGEAGYAAAQPGIREVMAGRVVQWEGEVRCATGALRRIVAQYLPDLDGEGGVHGFYGVIEEAGLQEQTQERLREAASRAARIEHQERRRLAEELHADLGQRLALLALRLRSLEEVETVEPALLEQLGELASDACRRLSSFGFRVYPTILYDVGVVAAARWVAEEMATSRSLNVHVAEAAELPDLDEEARTTLYRSLRELLDNVAQHAGKREAWVRFACESGWVRLEVEDSGVGMAVGAELAGYGLLRLREDARRLGGRVDVTSDGNGTRARVELPVCREGRTP